MRSSSWSEGNSPTRTLPRPTQVPHESSGGFDSRASTRWETTASGGPGGWNDGPGFPILAVGNRDVDHDGPLVSQPRQGLLHCPPTARITTPARRQHVTPGSMLFYPGSAGIDMARSRRSAGIRVTTRALGSTGVAPSRAAETTRSRTSRSPSSRFRTEVRRTWAGAARVAPALLACPNSAGPA